MAEIFARNLRVVAAVHAGIVILLVLTGLWKGCERRKKDVVIPMEFLVAVPPAAEEKKAEKENTEDKIPSEVPLKTASRKPEEKKPVKKPVKISTKPAARPSETKPAAKPLSAEEIKKLLEKGARPSDRTVIPDDDSICFGLVQQAFHDAWVQPSAAEAGNAVVEAEIRLALDGTVLSSQVVKSSGVDVMDQSVVKALRFVRKVGGLDRGFLERHGAITISFRVE